MQTARGSSSIGGRRSGALRFGAVKRTHFHTCPLCEASCGILIDVENGEITGIRGDERDVFSRGHVCPKAPALKDLHEDPDRLRHPMRRKGSEWTPISWDEALDEAAGRIHGIQEQHGRDAFAAYLGNPNAHNTGAIMYGPPLLRTLRSKNRFSATSVDQLPHMFAGLQMFGHQLFFPIPDLDRCDHFVIVGANPLASNGSVMTAPAMRRRLREIRARGSVTVIDPRRTETAKVASEHQFIRPGTDAWLLLAMVNEVFRRGAKLGRLEDFVDDLDVLQDVAEEFTPERAAKITGIDGESIRRIAGRLLENERAAIYGRMGACTQPFGGIVAWLINALNLLTGHFDSVGGVMFPTPAIDVTNLGRGVGIGRGHFGRWKSRVRGLPEFGGELPVSVLAEEILTPGDGQVRGLLTLAGNPVLSTPNGRQLDEALAKLDFMVSVDMYLNETTRHAHLILPPVSQLERLHYDLVFHAVAVRNTAKFCEPVFEAPAGSKQDWEITAGLRRRLEVLRDPTSQRAIEARVLEKIGPERLLDAGLRIGPYGKGIAGVKAPGSLPGKLSLKVLKQHPHGVDLGPMVPTMPEKLPKGRIDIAPEILLDDLGRLRASEGKATEGLQLIGRRHVRSNNSWMHNVAHLVRGKTRCTLMMHPQDADARSVENGDVVRVRSRVGEVDVRLEVTEDIMPGVVSLPHGFGHGRGGTRQRIADANAGVSMNDLTDHEHLDDLTGNAAVNAVPVEVSAIPAAAE